MFECDRRIHRLLVIMFMLSVFIFHAPTVSYAATIVVDGQCTLSDAILAANTDQAVEECVAGNGQDTIVLETDVLLQEPYEEFEGFNGLPKIESIIIIEGQGHRIARADDAASFRIFYVAQSGDLALQNMTVENSKLEENFIAGSGAGILNKGYLSLQNSRIQRNASSGIDGFGAGIYNIGTLYIERSTIANNTTLSDGGGIASYFEDGFAATVIMIDSIITHNSAYDGGGITTNGDLTVNRSSITYNEAFSSGGGILHFVRGSDVKLHVLNSTVSFNVVHDQTFGGGGAIVSIGGYQRYTSEVQIINSTMIGNAAIEAGGLSVYGDGQFTLANSIIAYNTYQDCDIGGEVDIVATGNLGSDSTCPSAQQARGIILALQNDERGIPYHGLFSNSNAVNAGTPSYCPDVDQLGHERVGTCDIGSFEFIED